MDIERRLYLKELQDAIRKHVRIDPEVDYHRLEGVLTTENVAEYASHYLDRFVRLIEWIEDDLPSMPMTMMEAGSWFPFVGLYFWALHEMNVSCCSIDGLDWDSNCGQLSHRQANLCDPLYQQSISNWNADIMVCTETLEHIPTNLVPLMQSFAHGVRPGGRLVLSVPFGGAPWKQQVDKTIDLNYPAERYNEHVRMFAEGELVSFAAECCPFLEVVRSRIVPGDPPTQTVMWRRPE